MWVYVCMYVCQRTSLNVVPWELSLFSFETRSLTGLNSPEQARLTVLQDSRDPPVFTSHLSIM